MVFIIEAIETIETIKPITNIVTLIKKLGIQFVCRVFFVYFFELTSVRYKNPHGICVICGKIGISESRVKLAWAMPSADNFLSGAKK